MSTHNLLSSSKVLISGIGYDPAIGPRSTGPQSNSQSVINSSNLPIINTSINTTTTTTTTTTNANNNQASSVSSLKKSHTMSSSLYDRNLHRSKHEISLSSLSFLFCETVSWCQLNSKSINQLEQKLSNLGYTIGLKYLELASLRENFVNGNLSSSGKSNSSKREIKIIGILQFIYGIIWKNLFGKTADNLERSQEDISQYMIIDNDPMMSRFISIPKEFDQLNVNSFIAGIIEGILDSSYFTAQVTAHTVPIDNYPLRTVFVIKFDKKVIKREQIRHIR